MTTAVSIEEITHSKLSSGAGTEKSITILREALERAGYTVLPPQKGYPRISRISVPSLEPSKNDAIVDVVISIKGSQNSPATKLANPQTQALLLTGRKIHFVSGTSSETSQFDWHSLEPKEADYFSRPIPPCMASTEVVPDFPLPEAVLKFRDGTGGERPTTSTADAAMEIAKAALRSTIDPEFILDSDGSLYYDLRLPNGQRVMAEMTMDGSLDAGFYDDSNEEEQAEEVRYLEQPTAEELIRFLR